jgi:hypothetical protein
VRHGLAPPSEGISLVDRIRAGADGSLRATARNECCVPLRATVAVAISQAGRMASRMEQPAATNALREGRGVSD